jgi:DNA topoisomerase VI subunit B
MSPRKGEASATDAAVNGGRKVDQFERTPSKLKREIFKTSRLLEFCSEKELVNQTGHAVDQWPLVILKELVDNAIDACEEADIAPVIEVTVRDGTIRLSDNGPGIGPKTVKDITDYSTRTSSREAYVSPTRGAQGNALKTILAMPFILDGGTMGETSIASRGVSHHIRFGVDHLRQEPKITIGRDDSDVKTGTRVMVRWPDSACSKLVRSKSRFLQIAEGFAWLNPHLTIEIDWEGETTRIKATEPEWKKWRPSDPTSPHWYTDDRIIRLMGAYVAQDQEKGREPRTVREFISEFRGLSGTAKQKLVLEEIGATRVTLRDWFGKHEINRPRVTKLLRAMQAHSRSVKPKDLGLIGEDHLRVRFAAVGADETTFRYKREFVDGDLPQVVEVAFGYCPEGTGRQLVVGVNWSPGINNPFRVLGRYGESLDTYLSEQRAGNPDEPITLVIHLACPRVNYTDRGKSALVVAGDLSAEQVDLDDEDQDDGEG